MKQLMNNALLHWKSTLSGFLTVTLVTTAGLLTYPPVAEHPKTMAILGGIQFVVKIWVSMIQQDSGKQLAEVPGQDKPVVVDAHQVPNDPAATAVVETK